jgi:hypothetical protein
MKLTHDGGTDAMDPIDPIHQASVADHLADLAREAAALRAERVRDHAREHTAAPDEALTHPIDLASPRARLGRWLVAMGEAIAGPPDTALVLEPSSPGTVHSHVPCPEDASDRLESAA